VIAVSDPLDENIWNGRRMRRDEWIDVMSSIGLQYRFDSSLAGASMHSSAYAGRSAVVNLDIAWQSVSPILQHGDGDDLFVQVVRSGTRWIEQRGQTVALGPGDVAVLDPLTWYNATVRERTCLSILRIPRSALRDRGLRHRFPVVCCPNPASPDVRAARDFVLYLAAHAGEASNDMLARLGEQCLDLMDVLVCDRSTVGAGRSNALTVLRAKQLISRHIGDHELSPGRIAAELSMSTSSLRRALQAHGLSAMDYASSVRLEHAARRLRDGASHGSIKAISYQCGFKSQAHFCRQFKARYGMTPREYSTSHGTAGDEAAALMEASAAADTELCTVRPFVL
jgi:AraC-like DNA-binding protein